MSSVKNLAVNGRATTQTHWSGLPGTHLAQAPPAAACMAPRPKPPPGASGQPGRRSSAASDDEGGRAMAGVARRV
jgi:hypothetical protein